MSDEQPKIGEASPLTPRELDVWLAERLFGNEAVYMTGGEAYFHIEDRREILPHYSTDQAAMIVVIEKMQAMGWNAFLDEGENGFTCMFSMPPILGARQFSDSLPLSIALAAKAALEATDAARWH